MRRVGRAVALAAVAAAAAAGVPAALAQDPAAPGAVLVEVCTDNALEGRVCKSFDSGSVLFAQFCGQLPLPPEACASATDGRVIDPALVAEFETTWAWRALRLQSRLDAHEPLVNTLWPHTHNSSNSSSYAPALSNIDPNQRYSMTDQLRMGVRAIEIDLHWAPSASGSPATGGRAVVMCHGRSERAGPTTVHLGCSVDRPLAEGLTELRDFLTAPGNEGEVVLLYLENQLDGDPTAHAEAAAAVEGGLGSLVARPPDGAPCAEMPLESTKADLLAAGHRVLIVGNCGPGAWGTWVHERGPRWDEGGDGSGYPAFPACLDDRTDRGYDTNWIRVYEDSTWLSAMVGGATPPVTPDEARAMVRCGVDMVGFDRLEPFDGRLEALVWSWAPDEPSADPARACAARGSDGRFRMAGCSELRAFACRDAGGAWTATAIQGPWADGAAACAAAGATWSAPPTGWENGQLGLAGGDGRELWLPIDAADVEL